MKVVVALVLCFLTGTGTASSAFDITPFPNIGDCLEYLPLDRQTTPRYMECSTPEGDKFSIPNYEFERDVGVGSDADLTQWFQPAATVVNVPPIRIVFYINKEFQRSTPVIYKVEEGSDAFTAVKPILILGDYLRPWTLNYYGYFCDNWITALGEGSYCDSDIREQAPSDFPYYAFSTHSGGNHCCFNLIIVDKESPHHVLYEYYGGTSAPRFKDVDEDGQYEMVAGDGTYHHLYYGGANQPSGPDIIWHMTPSGLSIATELMMKPLPKASTLASYKSRIADQSKTDDDLLYTVTLELIYSGYEKEAWTFFDDTWPAFFEYWSSRGRWPSDKNTANRTQKEETEFHKEEIKTDFVEEICDSLFARSLDVEGRLRFLGQTCNYREVAG